MPALLSRPAAISSSTSLFASRVTPSARRPRVTVAAAAGAAPEAATRRAALLLLGGSLLSGAPAQAFNRTPTVCADQDNEEDSDACRARVLARDAARQEDYAKFEARSAPKTAINVPVSKIDDEYTRSTLELADKFEEYFVIDVYNKGRVPLIKALKSDSQAWVTKYARGGSVRKQSARRFYIAVDAVLGHFASNGLAPFPASKTKVVRATIEEARGLLAEGK